MAHQNGANPPATGNWGRVPLQIARRQAFRLEPFARERVGRLYRLLAPAFLRLRVEDRLIKLDAKRMGYFVLHSMLACLQGILRVKVVWDTPAFQTRDVVGALQHFPDHVIAPHRKARSYLSRVLARNEVHRDDLHNQKLFVRVRRGYYLPNPALELEIAGQWANVYDLIHLDELEREAGNTSMRRFGQFIRQRRAPGDATLPRLLEDLI